MDKKTENQLARMLYEIPGLGSKSLHKLYAKTQSMEGILELSEEGTKNLIGKDILSPVQREYKNDKEGFLKRMPKINPPVSFVFYGDEDYPKRLKSLVDAPFGLYYCGRLPKEDCPTVSIIGARECSEYGRKAAELFGKTLAGYGVSVISGMARGIDGISQRAALSVGGESFGILGSGVDICYPKENLPLYEALKQKGGLISEYPPGTEAKSTHFPMRNRIISGLADILLVVEARQKSGTYITICQALEQGKEIFAVPGRITDGLSDGCNRIIAQGAGIAINPMAILDQLNLKSDRTPVKEGRKAEKTGEGYSLSGILRVLEDTPKSLEEIQESLGHLGIDFSHTDLMCKLTDLCIEGRVEGIGNYYRKIG